MTPWSARCRNGCISTRNPLKSGVIKVSNDLAYTVIRNKAYKNVTSMLQDEEDSKFRDYSKDSLTVVDWLEGSYPNFFFTVDLDDVNLFAERYEALQNR